MSNEPKEKKSGGFLSFLAFCVTMFAAVLYLIAMVLSFLEMEFAIINTMQSVASVLMICIVSTMGWRYVKTKSFTWKLVYTLILLAVVASVVVPVVLQFTGSQA